MLFKNQINLTIMLLLPDRFCTYFCFSSSRSFSRGRITLCINSFLSLLAMVSWPRFFLSDFEDRMIRSIFSRSLSRLVSPMPL